MFHEFGFVAATTWTSLETGAIACGRSLHYLSLNLGATITRPLPKVSDRPSILLGDSQSTMMIKCVSEGELRSTLQSAICGEPKLKPREPLAPYQVLVTPGPSRSGGYSVR